MKPYSFISITLFLFIQIICINVIKCNTSTKLISSTIRGAPATAATTTIAAATATAPALQPSSWSSSPTPTPYIPSDSIDYNATSTIGSKT